MKYMELYGVPPRSTPVSYTHLDVYKRQVWTMHDMWPFTGICHHAENCTNYHRECGRCPYLVAPSRNDLSNKIFKQKQTTYSLGKITFVACSNWLKDLAEKSPLTTAHTPVSIPRCV